MKSVRELYKNAFGNVDNPKILAKDLRASVARIEKREDKEAEDLRLPTDKYTSWRQSILKSIFSNLQIV